MGDPVVELEGGTGGKCRVGPGAWVADHIERRLDGDQREHGDGDGAVRHGAIHSGVGELESGCSRSGESDGRWLVGGGAVGLAVGGDGVTFQAGVFRVVESGEQQAVVLPQGDGAFLEQVGGQPLDGGALGDRTVFEGEVQGGGCAGCQRNFGESARWELG